MSVCSRIKYRSLAKNKYSDIEYRSLQEIFSRDRYSYIWNVEYGRRIIRKVEHRT